MKSVVRSMDTNTYFDIVRTDCGSCVEAAARCDNIVIDTYVSLNTSELIYIHVLMRYFP